MPATGRLGVRLGLQSVVGLLDDYPTRSGYVITPVVLWGDTNPARNPARDEVLAVYSVSLHALVEALAGPAEERD